MDEESVFNPFTKIEVDAEAYALVDRLLIESMWGGEIILEYNNFCTIQKVTPDYYSNLGVSPVLYIPFRIREARFRVR